MTPLVFIDNRIASTSEGTGVERRSVLSIKPNGVAHIDGVIANDAEIGEFMRSLARNTHIAQRAQEAR